MTGSKHPQDESDGTVNLASFDAVEPTREIAEAIRVDSAHLVNQDTGPRAVHLDFRTEDRRLCARGRGRHDQRRQPDAVTLHRYRVPGASLFVARSVLIQAEPVQVTTH
jgi:hypothetical protein